MVITCISSMMKVLIQKTYDGLSILDYCPDSTDPDKENEEDRIDREKKFIKNRDDTKLHHSDDIHYFVMGQDTNLIKVVVSENGAYNS